MSDNFQFHRIPPLELSRRFTDLLSKGSNKVGTQFNYYLVEFVKLSQPSVSAAF